MMLLRIPFYSVVLFSLLSVAVASGQEKKIDAPPCGRNVDDYFAKEVWAKVGNVLCVNCHKTGGDAEKSKFVLLDPRKLQGHAQDGRHRGREADDQQHVGDQSFVFVFCFCIVF